MIFLCVTREREMKTRRIMAALEQGSGGHGKLILGAPPAGEPFVVWGQRWLSEAIVPPAVRSGVDWWHVDNGFYWPANGRPTGYYAHHLPRPLAGLPRWRGSSQAAV